MSTAPIQRQGRVQSGNRGSAGRGEAGRAAEWTELGGGSRAKIRNLRLASVNVDSLNNIELPFQKSLLADLSRDADIVCMQETKLTAKDESAFLRKFNGEGVFSAVAEPGTNAGKATTGVAILFSAKILAMGLAIGAESRRADTAGRWVSVNVEWNGARYTIVSVYAPADAAERVVFLRELHASLTSAGVETTRLCMMGDFNSVLDSRLDRENPQQIKNGSGMEEFQGLIRQLSLVDVWRRLYPLAREYTGPLRTFYSRIDYVLLSEELRPNLVAADFEHRRSPNRHRVVRVTLCDKESTQWAADRAPFKVQQWMLADGNFCNVVTEAAEAALTATAHLPSKVAQYEEVKRIVTASAKCAARQLSVESKQENIDCRRALGQVYWMRKVLQDPLFGESDVVALKVTLARSREQREQLRAMVKDGLSRQAADRPTKAFLCRRAARRSRQAFRAVRIPPHEREGIQQPARTVTALTEMAEALRGYWAGVSQSSDAGFKKPPRDNEAWAVLLDHIKPMISTDEAAILGAPISVAELAEQVDENGVVVDIGILRRLKHGKSGGADGWSYEFIQLLWPTIGQLTVDSWNEACVKGGRMPGGGHLGLIHLLYKPSKNPNVRADPSCPENYRPISLLNGDGKLLARVLVRRLLRVIGVLIHSDQTGFIPGRSIEANIRIQHDVTHFFEQLDAKEFEEGGKYAGGVGRLDYDFEKAYDRVDIDFLIAACEKMGLGKDFSAWIGVFYKDAMAAVVVNGLVGRPYRLGFGVRQGDPLSPLLFDIIMETLAILVRRSPHLTSLVLPAGPGWAARSLRIILFADDFNHFFVGKQSIAEFRKILVWFRRASNLQTKPLSEVGLWWGPALDESTRGRTRWLEGTDFDSTLGIRFAKRITPETMCEPLEVRFARGLKSIEGMCWTPYGRAVLAQSLVVPIVVYFARVIVIPEAMVARLQKLVTDFVWTSNAKEARESRKENKDRPVQHLVGDKGIMRVKEQGGLPLQHIASVIAANQASYILRLLDVRQQTHKALPRFWVSEVGHPCNLGFTHVLSSGEPSIASSAPQFYRDCIRAFRSLPWSARPVETLEQLNNVPLWRNRAFGDLEPTTEPWIRALVAKGIRYVGQWLSPVTWKLSNTLPADVLGLNRERDSNPVEVMLVNRMKISAKIERLVARVEGPPGPRPLPHRVTTIAKFGRPGEMVKLWTVSPPLEHGGKWCGNELEVNEQGRLSREGGAVAIEHGQMLLSLHIRRTEGGEFINTYGAGDFNRADLSLQVTPMVSKSGMECKVKDMYNFFNREWAGKAKTSGLDRMISWVQAAGYKGNWLAAVCKGIRSPIVAPEERNLMWLVVHAAVRLGCRELAETRSRGEVVERDKFNCPVCGFGSSDQAEGEILDHAYGTCLELGALWDWAVTIFLVPVGGRCALQGSTKAQHLAGVASPSVVAGLLGLIVNARPAVEETAANKAKAGRQLNGWWAMVRGIVMVVIFGYRKVCRKMYKRHGLRFQRPGLPILQEQIKTRLRHRVAEEVAAVRSGQREGGRIALGPEQVETLNRGILFGGILGHIPPGAREVVLSKLMGGRGGEYGKRQQGMLVRRPDEAPIGLCRGAGKAAIVNFDGAAKKNPGNAGCAATLRAWDPPHELLASDGEYMGRQTSNVAEYSGMILGLMLARTHGISCVEVRGDSRLVINQMSLGWTCKKADLIRLQALARRISRFFVEGIAFTWVPREKNKDADKLASAQAIRKDARFVRRAVFFPWK